MKKVLLYFFIFVFTIANSQAHILHFSKSAYWHYFAPVSISKESYLVIGVKDGDTIVLLIDGKEQTVRLAHIDCPEKGQAFGKKAKKLVSDLCFGSKVKIKHNNEYDRYKRLIAEIILPNGTNLNQEIVKQGLAWHFVKYSDDAYYHQLEQEARAKKIGLWSDPNAQAPWDWRKERRSKSKPKQ